MHTHKKIKFSNHFLDSLALDDAPFYLKILRIQTGFSREDLAKALGFNAGSIRRYESNYLLGGLQ